MEPPWTDLSPMSSVVVPLLGTQIIVPHVYFPSFSYAENYHQMEEIDNLMIMSM